MRIEFESENGKNFQEPYSDSENILISTVVLNWNRCHLLKKTIESYLKTISVPYELIIVDNASTDGSIDYIKHICKKSQRHLGIFLTKNIGGNALNLGFQNSIGTFFHSSGNDCEYLPGWDKEILSKFKEFPELGQISLISPYPQKEMGEIWETKPATEVTRNNQTIFKAQNNVGMTSLIRKEVWEKGAKWETMPTTSKEIFLPADGKFSRTVKKLGYWVAWNDKYSAVNWGHKVDEWINNIDYYLKNYEAKGLVGLKGMKKRLQQNGYDLINMNGKYQIVKL